jgi:hypothetical protein
MESDGELGFEELGFEDEVEVDGEGEGGGARTNALVFRNGGPIFPSTSSGVTPRLTVQILVVSLGP